MQDKIEDILESLASGGIVVVQDDEDRENEGDLICISEICTVENISFMANYGRGLICVSLPGERVEQLGLPLMKPFPHQGGKISTSFCASVDAADGVHTGISAQDRLKTTQVLLSGKLEDLVSPGHMFPLKASRNGVLDRPGHTEVSSDLARMSGFYPSGLLCEIMGEDGSMLRGGDLIAYAKEHNLKFTTIESVIKYRTEKGI